MNRYHKLNYFSIAGSLVLLAILFSSPCSFAQIPKLFRQFAEKQNRVQSGYVKVESLHINMDFDKNIDEIDRNKIFEEEKIVKDIFFISTPKDCQFLVQTNYPNDSDILRIACKLAHSTVTKIVTFGDYGHLRYYYDEISDAKEYWDYFSYSVSGFSVERYNGLKTYEFQRIPPQMGKKNIRYKIIYPDQKLVISDQEHVLITNNSQEYEFERKTFHLVQEEYSAISDNRTLIYGKKNILEIRLYEYIHPDILDTISFMFEEIKKGYDEQCAEKQSEKETALRVHLTDSLVQVLSKEVSNTSQEQELQKEKDTIFFMPSWKFSSLSGDTIYSDSIHSRFLLIDMWFIACPPCMEVMTELTAIATLYEESLLKTVSINALDKDTAKMNKIVQKFNLKCDVACAFRSNAISEMSKKMGGCKGYPQLYLIDMKTKQVIWHSCGWREGFTKEIEKIIKNYE